jgi:hypothetical protein
MICEFCQYQHDNEGDRYGCPNCCGGEYDIDNQGQQCPATGETHGNHNVNSNTDHPGRCLVRRHGHNRKQQKQQKANGNTEKKMISMKSYTVVLEDGTTGAMSTVFLNAYDLIGKRITVRTKDENGVPCEKRGKLAEILEEWH